MNDEPKGTWKDFLFRRASYFILALGKLALLGTAFSFLGEVHWFFELATHFPLQYALCLLPFAIYLFYQRQLYPAIGAVLAAGYNAGLVLGLFLPLQSEDITRQTTTQPFTVMLSNLHTDKGSPQKLVRLIEKENPDIIALQEISNDWLDQIKPHLSGYPTQLSVPRQDNFGIGLYSKFPGKVKEVNLSPKKIIGVPSIQAELLIGKENITIITTHPMPPAGQQAALSRNLQLEALAKRARGAKEPVIIVGDLNITPWSPYFQKLLKDGDLQDSAQGFGWQPTWPAQFWHMLIPIDHMLTRGIKVEKRYLGPSIESDHWPLFIEAVRVKANH